MSKELDDLKDWVMVQYERSTRDQKDAPYDSDFYRAQGRISAYENVIERIDVMLAEEREPNRVIERPKTIMELMGVDQKQEIIQFEDRERVEELQRQGYGKGGK